MTWWQKLFHQKFKFDRKLFFSLIQIWVKLSLQNFAYGMTAVLAHVDICNCMIVWNWITSNELCIRFEWNIFSEIVSSITRVNYMVNKIKWLLAKVDTKNPVQKVTLEQEILSLDWPRANLGQKGNQESYEKKHTEQTSYKHKGESTCITLSSPWGCSHVI